MMFLVLNFLSKDVFSFCPACPPKVDGGISGSNQDFLEKDLEKENISIVNTSYHGSRRTLIVKNYGNEDSLDIVSYYFYSPGCTDCIRVNAIIKRFVEKYPYFKVIRKNILVPENQELLLFLCNLYKVPSEIRGLVPSIFIDKAFVGKKMIEDDLEKSIRNIPLLQAQLNKAGKVEKIGGGYSSSLEERFKFLQTPVVAFAGLVDGVNPCAFALLLFFLSYLLVSGRKGKEIFAVGALFAGGVFISYFLLGIGFLSFIYILGIIDVITRIIYPVAGFLALILGIYSFLDFLKARRGEFEKMRLKLPSKIRNFAHYLITKKVRLKCILVFSFFIGFLISLLEFLCTGQVYLPTIVYVAGSSYYRKQALFYLILYNIMFVLPLIGIFSLVSLGSEWESFNSWFLRRLSTVKFLTAFLFFFLSGYMFLTGLYIAGF